MLNEEEERELSALVQELERRRQVVRKIVFAPPGPYKARLESLDGAQCFRRVESAEGTTEFWHWEDP